MPKNHKKTVLTSVVETAPGSIAKAAQTIDSSGKYITGTGTSFKSDKTIVEGDWIFSKVNGEVLRIERIMSDTSLLLEDEPTAPLSTEALFITKASRAREISLVNIGANASSVDKVSLGAGAGMSFAEEMNYRGAQRDYPDPLVIDSTINGGSSVDVLIVY